MSASRRQSSGEDNILARLERDGKRGAAGKSWKQMNTTIAWCGLASLAVVGLIAVLASLAKENMAGHSKPVVVEAKAPTDQYADAGGFAPLPAVGSPPRRAAVLIEDPVPRAIPRASEAPHVPPPMVMLKPAAAVPAKPAATVAKPAAAAPAKPAAARVAPPRPAIKTQPARPAPVKVAATAPAKPVATAAPRPKKAVPAPATAKPETAAVDSDVALLSAIIMHASRHADERARIEAQTCPPGKKCSAPKATD
jgi:hypothetical protein